MHAIALFYFFCFNRKVNVVAISGIYIKIFSLLWLVAIVSSCAVQLIAIIASSVVRNV